jgi:hypothetical protein
MMRMTDKYKLIMDWIKDAYGDNVKSCYIAHVKDMCSMKKPNNNRKIKCPHKHVKKIIHAFFHFKMLKLDIKKNTT